MSHTLAGLNEIIEAVTVDCYGDDEELEAFLQAFEEELDLPMEGRRQAAVATRAV